MEDRKKRANNRQQELLVERLDNHLEMARGNQADPINLQFWIDLTNELNSLGCNRTVQQWQHVWSVWVAKVKTKARKISDSIRATGGGPAISELSDSEKKILDIVGIASIQGFASLEVGITPSSARDSPPAPVLLPSVQSPQEPQEEQEQPQPRSGVSAVPGPIRRRIVPRHRITPRPSRLPAHDNLIRYLQESSSSLQETIRHSAEVIAAALRDSSAATLRAAEILASAISSTHNSSHSNNINQ